MREHTVAARLPGCLYVRRVCASGFQGPGFQRLDGTVAAVDGNEIRVRRNSAFQRFVASRDPSRLHVRDRAGVGMGPLCIGEWVMYWCEQV